MHRRYHAWCGEACHQDKGADKGEEAGHRKARSEKQQSPPLTKLQSGHGSLPDLDPSVTGFSGLTMTPLHQTIKESEVLEDIAGRSEVTAPLPTMT